MCEHKDLNLGGWSHAPSPALHQEVVLAGTILCDFSSKHFLHLCIFMNILINEEIHFLNYKLEGITSVLKCKYNISEVFSHVHISEVISELF
jgi:hypothetical protein